MRKPNLKEIVRNLIKSKDVYWLSRLLFHIELSGKQREIVRLISFEEHRRISISAMTRYGKTLAVANGVALYILLHKNKRIALIAPQHEQAEILRNYLSELILKCPILLNLADLSVTGYERLRKEASRRRLTFKNGCEYQIFSAQGEAERLMGFGADLIIVDEACLVSRTAYSKIMRMLGDDPEHSILIELYNPWTKDSKAYEHSIDPDFYTIRIDWKTALREGRTTESFINEQRKELTPIEFHILYESEFPEDEEDTIFTFSEINRAINNNISIVKEFRGLVKEKDLLLSKKIPTQKEQQRLTEIKNKLAEFEFIISCDVADKGIDESVIFWGVRKGNLYEVEGCYSEAISDNMAITGKIIRFWKEKVPKDIKSKIIVDTIGVGVGVVSRLKEIIRTENLKTRVIPAHFGEQAIKKDKYLNKKAENYFRLKSLMEDDLIKILDLKKLRRDLSLMKFELSSNGKIKIIDPEKSPDYSDALVFFIWKGNKGLSFNFI